VIYLTPKELAKRFKVSPRQILNLARAGDLPGVRLGRLWRFNETQIEQWENLQGMNCEELRKKADNLVTGVGK